MKFIAVRSGLALGLAAAVLGSTLAAPTDAAAKTLTIEGAEFAFKPARITADVGETVTIRFKNTGAMSHNLKFKTLDGGTETIQSGNTATFKVRPEESGTYSFICTVPGHAQAGMKGKLIVE